MREWPRISWRTFTGSLDSIHSVAKVCPLRPALLAKLLSKMLLGALGHDYANLRITHDTTESLMDIVAAYALL